MAPDGRCKSFDARADGYVRSEGAGVVMLKRLSKAVADGDPIYAVIRGSAVNQDGRSNGLMAPNPLAQEAVLREAYRQAAVSPGQVQYIEAHGTGTLLGDPIEAKALGTVLATDRPTGQICALGSVKSNLGHLEAAAGVAGLIKVALALKHREIPPSLHFEVANPHIPFAQLPLRVQTALSPWPAELGQALAGVSSFGFGGTNAHVVLGEAPLPNAAARPVSEGKLGAHLLPLSARSPEALRSLARAYQSLLADPASSKSLTDICFTASRRLGHHDHRLAVVGESPAQLIESLGAYLRGETRAGLSTGRKHSSRRCKLAFVFSGQGSKWFGMGQRLLEREPVFRRTIEDCDRAMRLLSRLVVARGTVGHRPDPAARDAGRLHPAGAVRHAGGVGGPVAVLGYRTTGLGRPQPGRGRRRPHRRRAEPRRRRPRRLPPQPIVHVPSTVGRGAMAAVELSVEDAQRVLNGFEDRVSIAAGNSPDSTILSGDPAALDIIMEQLRRGDIFCRLVTVDFAAHSPQMEPLRAELQLALAGLQPKSESVPDLLDGNRADRPRGGLRSTLLDEEYAGAGAVLCGGPGSGEGWT